ncbi:PF09951 family protein [Peptoanaerobacter stomatis]|jgi:hypothetical protein|uniref:PF09951 family protein n=1 Tax=Peptoanaerobacter stomatis TaxID=796937 RepID=J4WEA4_9FIRM|nr:DUF2185 domain-containing protein [Peptoanaerobacter stomatis]EJU23691.1 PF09951 family protein [Peptoanaerobacter stomatis]NWO24290.1 DUF2185 domain-containing protein [Peptostreptococcaceae bacterium oral taxon 081]
MKEFGYVLATKKLVEEKLPVRFMYREKSKSGDSGWRFFAGVEDQEYVDDPDNIGIYDIKTITDIDKSIIPYLNSSVGVAFERETCNEDFKESKDFDFSPESSEV